MANAAYVPGEKPKYANNKKNYSFEQPVDNNQSIKNVNAKLTIWCVS